MTKPIDRDFLRVQLRRISAHWPLTPSVEVLDEYARVLRGFTEDEVARAFDAVIDTWEQPASPKPATFRRHAGQIANATRKVPDESDAPQRLCPDCDTTQTLWDRGVEVARNGIAHTPECPRFGEMPPTLAETAEAFAEGLKARAAWNAGERGAVPISNAIAIQPTPVPQGLGS